MQKSQGSTRPSMLRAREESAENGIEGRDTGKGMGGEDPAFQLPKVRATKYRYVSGANRALQGHNCGIWEVGLMCGP